MRKRSQAGEVCDTPLRDASRPLLHGPTSWSNTSHPTMLSTQDFFSFAPFASQSGVLAPIHPNVMGVTPKSPRKPVSSNTALPVPFSKRPIKSVANLLREKVGDRSSRINGFLNRVRQKGADKRWAARGGDDEVFSSELLRMS
jgi:hypothetical protein